MESLLHLLRRKNSAPWSVEAPCIFRADWISPTHDSQSGREKVGKKNKTHSDLYTGYTYKDRTVIGLLPYPPATAGERKCAGKITIQIHRIPVPGQNCCGILPYPTAKAGERKCAGKITIQIHRIPVPGQNCCGILPYPTAKAREKIPGQNCCGTLYLTLSSCGSSIKLAQTSNGQPGPTLTERLP